MLLSDGSAEDGSQPAGPMEPSYSRTRSCNSSRYRLFTAMRLLPALLRLNLSLGLYANPLERAAGDLVSCVGGSPATLQQPSVPRVHYLAEDDGRRVQRRSRQGAHAHSPALPRPPGRAASWRVTMARLLP